MVTEKDVLSALQELYKRVGTQSKLAELAGITQSTINAYLGGKAKIENMPVGVFLRLFRDIRAERPECTLVMITHNAEIAAITL